MPLVVGIRFKDSGKIYYFDPNNHESLAQGDSVIVETVRGLELAKVAYPPRVVGDEEIVGELKPVVRRAEPKDFERLQMLNERHDEVLERCAEKIMEHDLPMRLVKAEYSFDGSRLTFYFTSEKRVDFRMLVRDLARTFKSRIELRQIGPRDEAKLLGGIGPCGRLLCCATFLPDYARVSIKMAKDQDLPLNPTKISGVCGRLLCCLSYEHEQYLTIKAELPRKGAWVQTPDGPGEVVSVNVVKETVMVALAGSGVQEEFSPSQISEAAQRVGELARSRAEEGITPAKKTQESMGQMPQRGVQHIGERKAQRDALDDVAMFDDLVLLEDELASYEGDDVLPGPMISSRSEERQPQQRGGKIAHEQSHQPKQQQKQPLTPHTKQTSEQPTKQTAGQQHKQPAGQRQQRNQQKQNRRHQEQQVEPDRYPHAHSGQLPRRIKESSQPPSTKVTEETQHNRESEDQQRGRKSPRRRRRRGVRGETQTS